MKRSAITGNVTSTRVERVIMEVKERDNEVNNEVGIEVFLVEILIFAFSCDDGFLTERGHYEQCRTWKNPPGVQMAFRYPDTRDSPEHTKIVNAIDEINPSSITNVARTRHERGGRILPHHQDPAFPPDLSLPTLFLRLLSCSSLPPTSHAMHP
jgi:hypothetical protein